MNLRKDFFVFNNFFAFYTKAHKRRKQSMFLMNVCMGILYAFHVTHVGLEKKVKITTLYKEEEG